MKHIKESIGIIYNINCIDTNYVNEIFERSAFYWHNDEIILRLILKRQVALSWLLSVHKCIELVSGD